MENLGMGQGPEDEERCQEFLTIGGFLKTTILHQISTLGIFCLFSMLMSLSVYSRNCFIFTSISWIGYYRGRILMLAMSSQHLLAYYSLNEVQYSFSSSESFALCLLPALISLPLSPGYSLFYIPVSVI